MPLSVELQAAHGGNPANTNIITCYPRGRKRKQEISRTARHAPSAVILAYSPLIAYTQENARVKPTKREARHTSGQQPISVPHATGSQKESPPRESNTLAGRAYSP